MFKHDNGLVFKDLCIDPEKSSKYSKVFFSHAHSDHVKLSKKSFFYSTSETLDLIKARFGKEKNVFDENFFGNGFEAIGFGKLKSFDNFSLQVLPNGHLLGSSQLKLSTDGKDFVFTSDFRLRDSLFFKGAEPINCDVLVIESTFGSPEYIFPNQETVVSEMIDWISNNSKKGLIVLGGYSIGKAQELTRISNEAGIVPIVHESIFEVNKVYEKHGIKLGDYIKLNHNLKDSSVLIMPPSLVDKHLFSTLEFFDKRKIFSAIATGWNFANGFQKIFKLSDHADYNDLIEYVKLSNPKLVLTTHGFSFEFARKLNKLGFKAKPLEHSSQRLIGEF